MPVLILANINITKCLSRIFCSCSYKNFWTSGGTIVCPSERPECCEAKYRLFFYYILPFAACPSVFGMILQSTLRCVKQNIF